MTERIASDHRHGLPLISHGTEPNMSPGDLTACGIWGYFTPLGQAANFISANNLDCILDALCMSIVVHGLPRWQWFQAYLPKWLLGTPLTNNWQALCPWTHCSYWMIYLFSGKSKCSFFSMVCRISQPYQYLTLWLPHIIRGEVAFSAIGLDLIINLHWMDGCLHLYSAF